MIPKIVVLARRKASGQKGGIHHTEGIVGACTATDYKDPKYILEFTGGDEMSEEAEIIVMGLLDPKNYRVRKLRRRSTADYRASLWITGNR